MNKITAGEEVKEGDAVYIGDDGLLYKPNKPRWKTFREELIEQLQRSGVHFVFENGEIKEVKNDNKKA